MSLILNLQYWDGDKVQAMALARLLADLEPIKRTDVTFLFSARFDSSIDEETVRYVSQKFNVRTFKGRKHETGWPAGPNGLFRESFTYCIGLSREKGRNKIDADAVMFMEADCVPLHREWLNMLLAEWKSCGKKVLGPWLKKGDAGCEHINGNCIIALDLYFKIVGECGQQGGWDATCANIMLPNGHPSRLMFSDYGLGKPGYNEWKGCDYLFAAKRYTSPTNALYGQDLFPAWYHGPKIMAGIECVRERLLGEKIPAYNLCGFSKGFPTLTNVPDANQRPPTTDIFVVTYAQDSAWTEYLLRSIQKYARGFRQTIVVFPNRDKHIFEPMVAKFKDMKAIGFDEASDGHMHHNIIKCTADTFSDADAFLHIDSDCVFLEVVTPTTYMTDGKPDLLFDYYAEMQGVPWRQVTEAALGIKCEVETMRRHPFLYPRELYKLTRDRVELVNKMGFEKYVFGAQKLGGAHRGFSEFNALGCAGYYLYPEMFNMVHASEGVKSAGVRQYWSWSGLTSQERFDLEWVTKGWDESTEYRDNFAAYVKTQR